MKSLGKLKYPYRLAAGLALTGAVLFGCWSVQPAVEESSKAQAFIQTTIESTGIPALCGGDYKFEDASLSFDMDGFFSHLTIYRHALFKNSNGRKVTFTTESYIYTGGGRVYSQTKWVNENSTVAQLTSNAFKDCLGGVK